MISPDVNVLLYAFREDSADHERYRDWLRAVLTGAEPVGMSELVLSGGVRIATHHRAYRQPSSVADVLAFCDAMLSAPSVVPIRPGARRFAIFAELCRIVGPRGHVVPDAYHAALAIEQGATWITTDRGFARFPGLSWRLPA
ncbi:type II toxin-antitoxin system VapC family toxin [Flexivirga caeni]|uniref:Ribonuclease VapC n=1 Tax=Flexivirga caeni TaxID=2294115 RepID=A0A3M9M7X2_9MICO|nr:type II toxin-antitoxin system VapC family toxin [Flexivirga caeni]RNI21612.1 PIN domain-containing protein [Flexivirga caeni]